MNCRHEKENRIQLSEYKDCYGCLQPLEHTHNRTYGIERVKISLRCIFRRIVLKKIVEEKIRRIAHSSYRRHAKAATKYI